MVSALGLTSDFATFFAAYCANPPQADDGYSYGFWPNSDGAGESDFTFYTIPPCHRTTRPHNSIPHQRFHRCAFTLSTQRVVLDANRRRLTQPFCCSSAGTKRGNLSGAKSYQYTPLLSPPASLSPRPNSPASMQS